MLLAAGDFIVRIGMAIILARIAALMISTKALPHELIVSFVIGLALVVTTGWRLRTSLANIELVTMGKLETRCLGWFEQASYADMQKWQVGDLVNRVQTHPKSLAGYWTVYPVARAMVVIGSLTVFVAMLAFSWQAAMLLLLSLPVMVVFMALIGGMIGKAAQMRETESQYLSSLFADRIRTLPTILAHDAEGWAQAQLYTAADLYSRRTMEVLRIAFLNSGVLDFFSSLSIAMLAVFLGLGHLGLAKIPGFFNLTLSNSLSILLLAPLFFVSFRKFAEYYHLKADGEAALLALASFADSDSRPERQLGSDRLGINKLMLANCKKTIQFQAPSVGLVVFHGPSGCGKTTLLRCLAGIERPVSGFIRLPGQSQSWCSADLYVAQGSLSDAISFPETDAPHDMVEAVAIQLGLGNTAYLPNGISTQLNSGGTNLSGGQRMRLALARSLYSEPEILFCDEPTAKLDCRSASLVRDTLIKVAHCRLVIVASHDPSLIAIATHSFNLLKDAYDAEAPVAGT